MTNKQNFIRAGHIGIVALALILIAIGTTFYSPLPIDENEFRNEVSSWVANGMSVNESTSKLNEKGFKVRRGKPSKNWEDQRDYLYATRQKYIFPLFSREWRVICSIGQEESIVGIQTMVFFHTP